MSRRRDIPARSANSEKLALANARALRDCRLGRLGPKAAVTASAIAATEASRLLRDDPALLVVRVGLLMGAVAGFDDIVRRKLNPPPPPRTSE